MITYLTNGGLAAGLFHGRTLGSLTHDERRLVDDVQSGLRAQSNAFWTFAQRHDLNVVEIVNYHRSGAWRADVATLEAMWSIGQ